MRLHIYFIGMIDGRFASDICHTCVIFSTNLYRSCIYTFRRKKFFGHKFHIDRRDSERSSKLPSMNHFTLYKKRIPKQIICLFHIAFYDLFPHKRTADVPSLILDLVYHSKGIAICRGQFFQQNMIPLFRLWPNRKSDPTTMLFTCRLFTIHATKASGSMHITSLVNGHSNR